MINQGLLDGIINQVLFGIKKYLNNNQIYVKTSEHREGMGRGGGRGGG